jgi:phenylalanyl-tRNA synthetase beta chain
MKLSEQWLREWVNPTLTNKQLAEKLTMAGLEVESVTPVAEKFTQVVISQVVHAEQHPQADRLKVCQVSIGSGPQLNIVCGGTNVRVGMKVPVALDGAVLRDNFKIKRSKLRGVVSEGMLCSAAELGLVEDSGGSIFELPDDAPLGVDVWEYLKLADHIIDVSVTPNRGDCLSVLGLAKEIAALTQCSFNQPVILPVPPKITDKLPITIREPEMCSRYVGRVIRGVKANAQTPMWMQERLRRAGMRCISPVVDVTNYVQLELGQPMHAFDLEKISQSIEIRKAKTAEELKLLDGQTITLSAETLVIADSEKPLALAGVMGGLDSAVSLLTKDIFLESAVFNPQEISRMCRQYNLGSDSSYRFERGIDPELRAVTIERATQLLLEIVGGQPGPIVDVIEKGLPKSITILLRAEKMQKLLGISIPAPEVENIFQRLGFSAANTQSGWQVTVPPRRSDIKIEEDLIEEAARVYGYEKILPSLPVGTLKTLGLPENQTPLARIRQIFCDLGYHEVITYSFIDKKQQALFDPQHQPKELLNPITSEMAVMRTSLWPGLVNVLLYNQARQQSRIRIFETGLRFLVEHQKVKQEPVLSGLISGDVMPEQWGSSARPVDFFDVKGDLENLFKIGFTSNIRFKPGNHPALHPGQTAIICREDKEIGILGALHPNIAQNLDISSKVFLFEFTLTDLEKAQVPSFKEISKFPEIRRDIAILVDQSVPSDVIQDTIVEVGGELLKEVVVFDIYQGKGITPDRKSVALALTLQHSSRTLVDQEVTDLLERIVLRLKEQFSAELRG